MLYETFDSIKESFRNLFGEIDDEEYRVGEEEKLNREFCKKYEQP